MARKSHVIWGSRVPAARTVLCEGNNGKLGLLKIERLKLNLDQRSLWWSLESPLPPWSCAAASTCPQNGLLITCPRMTSRPLSLNCAPCESRPWVDWTVQNWFLFCCWINSSLLPLNIWRILSSRRKVLAAIGSTYTSPHATRIFGMQKTDLLKSLWREIEFQGLPPQN